MWLAGLALLLLLAVSPAAAQQPQGHQIYLPLLVKVPGSGGGGGGGGGQSANFFLPNRPGGSIVTTGLPEIAVDAAGGVHAVYAARTADSSGARPAYYAYCPANCVSANSFTTVSLGDLMSYAQLVLNPAGQPRLLLTSGTPDFVDHYQYAECNNNCTNPAQWSVVEVASGRMPGAAAIEQNQSFALDAQGRPAFVYMADSFGVDPAEAGTFYVSCQAGCTQAMNWVRSKFTDDLWTNPALAFTPGPNSQPRLVVGVTDYTNIYGWLAYFECNANCIIPNNWYGTVLAWTDQDYYHTDAVYALRLDRNGHPRLAIQPWQGYSDYLHLGQLSYMACDANCAQYESWTALDLGLPSRSGEGGVDLALDSLNRPRIAYRIPAPTDELAYIWCNVNCETSAQGWQSQIIPTTAAAQQEFPFDPMQGCPSPTCIPPIPPCTSAFWDAGYWPSLTLDGAGNPRLAFDLKHQHTGGGCTAGSFIRLARFVSFNQP
jgi:hypothetical protein